MANRLHILKRTFLAGSAMALLGTVGCAFPHGSTAGDPLLGNFNRPIVATPPPERGGLGLDSPAYDGGARIGMLSPDIAAPVENSSGFMTLPSLTSSSLFSGARIPFGAPDDSTFARKPMTGAGARLPSTSDTGARLPSQSPSYSVGGRPRDPVTGITSAASFVPAEPSQIRHASYEVSREPARMETMDDGNKILQAAGARGQRMEQLSPNEWLCACTVGQKVYEARGQDQMDAMKKMVEQVQKGR
jgi:hypothetical protein